MAVPLHFNNITDTETVVKRLQTMRNNIQKVLTYRPRNTGKQSDCPIIRTNPKNNDEQHKGRARVSLIRTDDDGVAAFDSDLVCIGILI